ncbi:hypothetical protein H6P81_003494 [Aristolochia fimbriata]|uniref:RNase H type-1 domain-containing protein n=1 Tax=Aristolochia fimbriata TaxID=158543 RepID=A0AAV7FGH8_ARIFI|nr:hypothetical protein H6P81_003494 [Aristolochia fimbriata]
MYFNSVVRRNGAGVGVLFVSPRKDLLLYSFVLTQNCSNNEAEYQAILFELDMPVEMKLPQLNIYGDSALVIRQLTGEFEVKKLELVPFWRHAGEPISNFLRYDTLLVDLRERIQIRRTAPSTTQVIPERRLGASGQTVNALYEQNQGKFAPKWEGSYVVQEAYTNGAYKLVTSNGSELPITNGKFLKRFDA